MKTVLATSLGKAAAFSAIALAVSAAVAQDAERIRPLVADVKINKQLIVTGQPPANFNPQFTFNVHVTENRLPPAPEGCRWEEPKYEPAGGNTTAITGNGVTGAPAQVTVINQLICRPRTPCDDAKALSISLNGLSQWVRQGGGSFVAAPSTTYANPSGTVNWVGVNANATNPNGTQFGPGGTYQGDIQFCLCEGGKATADVKNYRADNSAVLKFDSAASASPSQVTAPTNSFNFSAVGAGGGSTSTSVPGTRTLSNILINIDGMTAWTMDGKLEITKGYVGACKMIK